MNSPFFSVVIPVFNRCNFIAEALNTVKKQSFDSYEIIVIDDASTDRIQETLKPLTGIVKIRNDENMGVSYSRNKGIEKASGKYIALLDSDDLWEKNKLETQYHYLKQNAYPELLHCDETWIRNGKHLNQSNKHKKEGGYLINRMLELCLVSPSAVVIRRDIFDRFGYFDESLIVCEDYDLWLRYNLKFPFHYLDEKLVIKRGGHQDQLSHKYSAMDKYRLQSLKKILESEIMNPEHEEAFLRTIHKKAEIMLKGAIKRTNRENIRFSEEMLNFVKQFPG